MAELLRADLHIHTIYSMDSATSLEKIISRCLETGINCIAITDHDRIEGALKMQGLAPFPVIVGEEIWTLQGEIIGLFLTEAIPHSLRLEEAVSRIKAQDGLLYIPHPFDPSRGASLIPEKTESLAEQIDVIEIFNGRTPLYQSSTKARAFAERYGIAQATGSDAHTIDEIGKTYVEIAEFEGKTDFLQALREGKIHHGKLR